MFKAIVTTQWKWTRTAALLATLAAFGIPLASLQTARATASPVQFIASMQAWGVAYALLATIVGLLVATTAWGHDHQGRHVYALSLPISRARYSLLRFGAGAIFLLAPVIGVLVGSLLVAASGVIPEGLHAFPIALTLRFALAAAVAYAVFFAIGSGTTKTAAIILGVIAALLVGQWLLEIIGIDYNLLSRIGDFVFVRPGLLSVFSGRWMLVDV